MADNTTITIAADDIGGIQYQRVKPTFGDDGSATDTSHANPFPIVWGLSSPQVSYATSASIAAGGSADLDSAQINSGKTGELMSVILGASVPAKWLLKTVLNGVETTRIAFFTHAGCSYLWTAPSKKIIRQAQNAGAGFDGFRVTVTNLDTSEAADVYTSFLFDEV